MAKKVAFYRPHDRAATAYTGDLVDQVTGEVTTPPSMTKQSFVAECDINNIVKQYSVTGMVTHMSAQAAKGSYADLPDPMEFQEALAVVEAAEKSFATLPAKVRDRFANDALGFLAFVEDPANKEELVKLGLAQAQAPAPAPAPVPPPAPAPGGTGG